MTEKDNSANNSKIAEAYERYTVGDSLFREQKYDLAIVELNKAIELNPDLADAYFDRAYINGLIYKNDISSINDLSKAIELKPDSVLFLTYRGNIYFHTQQYEKAIKDIEKIVELTELNPDDYAMMYWQIGESYIYVSELNRAIEYLNKSIEYDPASSLPYSARGFAYLKKGQLQSAIKDMNKAIELESDNSRAYYYRAEYYLTIGDNNNAKIDLKTVLKLGGSDYLKQSAENKLKILEK